MWFLSDGHGFQNKHSKQYDGIETKTGGGYVVVPPAPGRHWIAGKRTTLPAPEWLKELFPRHEPPPVAPTKTTTAHTPYGQKTLDRLTLRIAAAPRGEQDDTRTRLAFTIGHTLAAAKSRPRMAGRKSSRRRGPLRPASTATPCARKDICAGR